MRSAVRRNSRPARCAGTIQAVGGSHGIFVGELRRGEGRGGVEGFTGFRSADGRVVPVRRSDSEGGKSHQRQCAATYVDGHDDSRQGRSDDHLGRPFRRDQGADGRILHNRCKGLGRGPRVGDEDGEPPWWRGCRSPAYRGGGAVGTLHEPFQASRRTRASEGLSSRP